MRFVCHDSYSTAAIAAATADVAVVVVFMVPWCTCDLIQVRKLWRERAIDDVF